MEPIEVGFQAYVADGGEELGAVRRWRVTHLGHAVMSTAVLLREEHFPSAFLPDAA